MRIPDKKTRFKAFMVGAIISAISVVVLLFITLGGVIPPVTFTEKLVVLLYFSLYGTGMIILGVVFTLNTIAKDRDFLGRIFKRFEIPEDSKEGE